MLKFKGQPWTYDELNEWLYKPSAYAPGTRMTFAGINNDKQRADVIAYLRTLSDNPEPLPAPEAAAAGSAAPAGAARLAVQRSPAQRSRGRSPGGAQPAGEAVAVTDAAADRPKSTG